MWLVRAGSGSWEPEILRIVWRRRSMAPRPCGQAMPGPGPARRVLNVPTGPCPRDGRELVGECRWGLLGWAFSDGPSRMGLHSRRLTRRESLWQSHTRLRRDSSDADQYAAPCADTIAAAV